MDIRENDTWEEHWQSSNKSFEEILKNDKNYERFCDKIFFVWEGNHRVTVWYRHIDKVHGEDKEKHYSIDCIVLESTGSVTLLLNAMHDVHKFVSCSLFFYIFLVYNYKIIKFIDIFCHLSYVYGIRSCQDKLPHRLFSMLMQLQVGLFLIQGPIISSPNVF
jgi:hypothetical protein